jgi:hypothetical protein
MSDNGWAFFRSKVFKKGDKHYEDFDDDDRDNKDTDHDSGF